MNIAKGSQYIQIAERDIKELWIIVMNSTSNAINIPLNAISGSTGTL